MAAPAPLGVLSCGFTGPTGAISFGCPVMIARASAPAPLYRHAAAVFDAAFDLSRALSRESQTG